MPFAVYLYFNAELERRVRAVWSALASTGVAPYMHASDLRPHLTLSIHQQIDNDRALDSLAELAQRTAPLPLNLPFLGLFVKPAPVVFIAPILTRALLDLHAETHRRMSALGDSPARYYSPDQWQPHCTLALELPTHEIARACEIVRGADLPFDGEAIGLGAIQFEPVEILCEYPFGGETASADENG